MIMFLLRMLRFMFWWTIGRYVCERMAARRKRTGEWTTVRFRGFALVAALFVLATVVAVYYPQEELWLWGGALFVGEGLRRIMAGGRHRV